MLFILLLAILSACERPFVEVSTPTIDVVEPDLSTVFTDATVDLSVSARSFRQVEKVTLNGSMMTYVPDRDLWTITLELSPGLNTLVFEAFDIEDVASIDTAYAVHLPYQVSQNAPRLPVPRGGHTTTVLEDGTLLVTGGTTRIDGPAHDDAYVLRPNSVRFVTLDGKFQVARTGHSATLLPDGRVLFLGGSHSEAVNDISDLVETVEIFDPSTSTFGVVPFDGQPIRRTLHTAVLRPTTSGVLIDLYGGRGDIRYGDTPRLGTRRDLRTFEFENDTLFERNTLRSAPYLEAALSGHTETEIQPGIYLVFGSFFDAQFTDDVSFRIDYTRPPDLVLTDVPPLLTPRTRHAAATIADDFVVVFGGHQTLPTDLVAPVELFSNTAGRFFTVPANQPIIKRFGQTATNLTANRILLLGGFATNGNSLTAAEFFDADLTN